MTDYNISFSGLSNSNLETSIAYGASSDPLTSNATVTMSPASGISSVMVDFYLSGVDTSYFTAVSASASLPIELINGQDINLAVSYNNNYLHAANEFKTIAFTASANSAELSATANPLSSVITLPANFSTTPVTLTALGDATAPSGVTGFSIEPGSGFNRLTWVNPVDSDLSAVRVNYSLTTTPASYSDGTLVYDGLGTTTDHTVNTILTTTTNVSALDDTITSDTTGVSFSETLPSIATVSSSRNGSILSGSLTIDVSSGGYILTNTAAGVLSAAAQAVSGTIDLTTGAYTLDFSTDPLSIGTTISAGYNYEWTDYVTYYYSIFSLDNVGNWSILTSDTSGSGLPIRLNDQSSTYGVSWGTFLTDDEIRRRLYAEGII